MLREVGVVGVDCGDWCAADARGTVPSEGRPWTRCAGTKRSGVTGASDGSIRVWELAQQPQNMRAWGIGIGRPGWQRVRELSPRHVLRQPRWSPVMSLRVTTLYETYAFMPSASFFGSLR